MLDIYTYKKIEKDMFVLVPGITKEQLYRACLPAVATAMSPRCHFIFMAPLSLWLDLFFFLGTAADGGCVRRGPPTTTQFLADQIAFFSLLFFVLLLLPGIIIQDRNRRTLELLLLLTDVFWTCLSS